jgi:proline iminopeptidase
MNNRPFVIGAVMALVSFAPHQAASAPKEGLFENAGLVLHYAVSGRGSPVVVLAGGPGFGASYMQPVVDMVANDHTVVLLEQRGTGHSLPAEETPATVNEDLVVSDLEALRRKLGYARWTLLGHSFGTFTAMKYAIAYPDHVRAIALLAVMPPRSADDTMDANLQKRLPPSTGPAFHALMVKMKGAKTDAERTELAGQMNGLLLPAYLYDPSKTPELVTLARTAGMNAQTAQLINQSVGKYDLVPDLAKLKIPVLIIQGSADPLDPTMAAKTQKAIPGATLTVIENCGHFAWLEAPGALSAQLKVFLSDK